MWQDFKTFLLTQNALALAIAVVIGAALNKVVTAVVDDFIMPIVGAITPSGQWQTATWDVGAVKFGVGDFLSALLNFLIVGIVAWRLSKLVPAAPAPATKSCPQCFNSVDVRATRCQHCTATI
jgi:large conductance mechanosensitive channel